MDQLLIDSGQKIARPVAARFRLVNWFRPVVYRFRLVNWFRPVADGFRPMLIVSNQLLIDSGR